MGRRGFARSAALACTVGVLHCGTTSFSGSGDDAGSGDSGSDVTSSDAIADSPASDSGIDGPYVFDDPCAAHVHSLCCDFDQDAEADAGTACIGPSPQIQKGSLGVSQNEFKSPPSSLHSTGNTDGGYGYVTHLFPEKHGLTCTFDTFVDQLNGLGHNIFAIDPSTADTDAIVAVIDPDADGLAAHMHLFGPMGDGGGNALGQLAVPFRTWTRMRLSFILPTSGPITAEAAILSFDGGAPLELTTDKSVVSQMEARVGIDFVGTGNADVYIDNLACDAN